MFLQVFIVSSVILVPAVLGIGVKLLFNKNAMLPSGCRPISADNKENFTCVCGNGSCMTENEIE
jgi:hypothetical protein